LIREHARLAAEREVASYNDAIAEVRREHQSAYEAAERAKGELRHLLTTQLALLDKASLERPRETAPASVRALHRRLRSPPQRLPTKARTRRRTDISLRPALVRTTSHRPKTRRTSSSNDRRRAPGRRHRTGDHARGHCRVARGRPDVECVEAPVGGDALARGLPALPDETRALCDRAAAILFGSVGLPAYDGKPLQERPEYALFLLRRDYELFANVRPVRVFPGLEDASTLKPELVRGSTSSSCGS